MHDVKDEENWTCPICLDILYKPCVNLCGHIFCFWCMHRSMSWGLGKQNTCPCCRREYSSFPAVCEALHHFIKRQFPQAYARREAATKVEEDQSKQGSFLVDDLPDLPEQEFYKAVFACTECSEVVQEAMVLGCGHLVCGGGRHPELEQCSKCQSRVFAAPSACRPLVQELVSAVCPDSVNKDPPRGRIPETSAAAETLQERDKESEEREEDAATSPQREEQAADSAPEEPAVVHYGVGCDGMSCGICPIVGRRYRCLDCPEHFGYDLCGRCFDHSLNFPNLKGRFGQRHQPDHKMELIKEGFPLHLDAHIRGLFSGAQALDLDDENFSSLIDSLRTHAAALRAQVPALPTEDRTGLEEPPPEPEADRPP